MARTWLSIRVELVGGRGDDLWPYPGRVLLVGPSHTFADLASAIDAAFARWDRAHLCRFTLADGRVVTDEETAEENLDSPFGPIGARAPLVLDRVKVATEVALGDEFSYVFDFGDDWTHACTVESSKVDPVEVLGLRPMTPTASWGWGIIPDQYGRRWDRDGSGEPMPRRPSGPHPIVTGDWPATGPARPVDLAELRGAIRRGDASAVLAAIEGREVDDLLQHVGLGAQLVLAQGLAAGESLAASVSGRLRWREWAGDDVLAEDLIAQLRGEPLNGRPLAVDLADVADELSNGAEEAAGLLDLRTGEVVPGALLDPSYASEDDDGFVNVDLEPERWLELEPTETRVRWRDMADFAESRHHGDLRRRLEGAIEGKGAFRRFRDVVDAEDVVDPWAVLRRPRLGALARSSPTPASACRHRPAERPDQTPGRALAVIPRPPARRSAPPAWGS